MLKKSDKYHLIFNRIIDLCDKKNITVSNIVDMFATSKSAMTAWKKGNILPDTLAKIAEYFGVSVDYLTTGKGEITLTPNELEMLEIYQKFNEHEQAKLIGRLEEIYDRKMREENIGVQVARTIDGEPVRQPVTPEILEQIKKLPEDTDY